MATYYETKAGLDEIAAILVAETARVARAKANIAQAFAAISALQTEKADFIQQLNADAAANPADPAWQFALAEKDLLRTEFLALQATLAALNTAVGN